jgi:hypothetical protein
VVRVKLVSATEEPVFVIKLNDQYYALYTSSGPLFMPSKETAYKFYFASKAENVIQGDERLKGATIEEL